MHFTLKFMFFCFGIRLLASAFAAVFNAVKQD